MKFAKNIINFFFDKRENSNHLDEFIVDNTSDFTDLE
jgi:hypothetical protein